MLHGVPAHLAEGFWPEVAPYLARALERGVADLSLEDIKQRVLARDQQLWVWYDQAHRIRGAGLTEIARFPSRRVCLLHLGACDAPREEWQPALAVVERWAILHGCDEIRIPEGRKGWARALPDYSERAVVLGKSLAS